MRKRNCGTSNHRIFFVRRRELRDLKSKLLYGSGTAKLQVVLNLLYGNGTAYLPSHSIFLVRKRNCSISELQVTHFSVCESGTAELRNCGTLSLSIFRVQRRNFKPQNISCVEAELQNFKSHNSLCAEAEFQVT